MMLQPTGIKILKRYGLTTGRVEKNQSASRRSRKLHAHGERKIPGGYWLTPALQGQFVEVVWCDSPAADAEKKSPSLTTKTMTSLWRLFGFANHATSNGIKK